MTAGHIDVLVVDDEKLARTGLREMLRADPELVVSECGDGRTAVQLITQSSIDLVFLDVRMRGLDGFDVIEQVGAERMPIVVFTTAYDSYAIRAFESCALDYLLKPITEARLAKALARAKEAVRQRRLGQVSQQLAALLAQGRPSQASAAASPMSSDLQADRVLVRSGTSSYYVSIADVDWAEAADNYSRLWVSGQGHLVRIALNRLEEQLASQGFVRTHRTALVRARRIRELRNVGLRRYVVVLTDGTRVPVSRDRRGALLRILRDAPSVAR